MLRGHGAVTSHRGLFSRVALLRLLFPHRTRTAGPDSCDSLAGDSHAYHITVAEAAQLAGIDMASAAPHEREVAVHLRDGPARPSIAARARSRVRTARRAIRVLFHITATNQP
jgi:hypothetical protein